MYGGRHFTHHQPNARGLLHLDTGNLLVFQTNTQTPLGTLCREGVVCLGCWPYSTARVRVMCRVSVRVG